MKHSPVVLAIVAVVAGLAPAASAAPAKPVKLEWRSVDKPGLSRPDGAALAFFTESRPRVSVADARAASDPDVVGSQVLEGQDLYVWRSTAPVAPAVEAMVTKALADWSLHPSPEGASVLHLRLTRFFVDEKAATFGSTYVAAVGFDASLERGGRVVWKGTASGESKRSGVDGRAVSCNESFSLALDRALASLLNQMAASAAPVDAGTVSPSAVTQEPAPRPAPVPPPVAASGSAGTTIEPDALFAELTRLKAGGVADDVLVAYVEQRHLSRPLSVDDILKWKGAGLPDVAIKAAARP